MILGYNLENFDKTGTFSATTKASTYLTLVFMPTKEGEDHLRLLAHEEVLYPQLDLFFSCLQPWHWHNIEDHEIVIDMSNIIINIDSYYQTKGPNGLTSQAHVRRLAREVQQQSASLEEESTIKQEQESLSISAINYGTQTIEIRTAFYYSDHTGLAVLGRIEENNWLWQFVECHRM